MKRLLIGLSVMTFVLISCSKTNETTQSQNNNGNTSGNTTGTGGCDTVNMKYAANIQPIIQANCYSCHGNGNVSGGVSLGTYTGVKQQADKGNLLGTITHASGYPAMPQGSAKLDDCTINKIKDWIARGAQNN